MEAKFIMLKGEKGEPGGSTWGNISGTLSNQTDLNTVLNGKANTSALGAVAFSNDYDDLNNKPTYSTVATTGSYNDLIDKPNLSAVATSGAYEDLSGRPTQLSDLQGILGLSQGGTGGATAVEARTNLDVLKEYDLLESGVSTVSTVTLNDSIMNYKKIGVVSYDPREGHNKYRGYNEIYITQGITLYSVTAYIIMLTDPAITGQDAYFGIRLARLTFEGNTMKFEEAKSYNIKSSGVSDNTDGLVVYRVIGFKY